MTRDRGGSLSQTGHSRSAEMHTGNRWNIVERSRNDGLAGMGLRLVAPCLLFLFAAACTAQSTGDGPLHDAVTSQDIEEVQRLLDAGGDVDAKNSDGFTPLMFAAGLGNYAIAELLVERGASLNEVNKYDATAPYSHITE